MKDVNTVFHFEEIGLDNRDRRVYEALLERPGSSLRKLAEYTSINRGSVYESIKQLVGVGLVGSLQTGAQIRYIAKEPELIFELLRERQARAKEAEKLAERYIRGLQPARADEHVQFAIYYEGDEGIAAILRDVLATVRDSEDKHYYVVSSKRIRHYIYNNFRNYTQQRIKAGIGVSVIAVGEGGEHDELANRRWLPATDHYANCYTIIYSTKTAFISLNEENVLSGIVIDNTGVTTMQRQMFSSLWENVCTPTSS